eukprot:359446-Chlamydomonas_euryale.AAC.9
MQRERAWRKGSPASKPREDLQVTPELTRLCSRDVGALLPTDMSLDDPKQPHQAQTRSSKVFDS